MPQLQQPVAVAGSAPAHCRRTCASLGLVEARPGAARQVFPAFVSAALRLDRVAMRDWLRKRLRNRPLAAPIDLAGFAISDRDLALLLKQLPLRANDADGGTGL